MAALWDHQRDAVKAAVSEVGTGGRCQVIMACGTGKTVVGAEVSRQVAPGGRVLIVVPTLELLAQTARSYAEHLSEGAGLIAAVCSESAATMEAAEIRSEMEHLHAGVSTDPEKAAEWARSPGRVTMLVTYQSLHVIAAMSKLSIPAWDLIVIDEAHRSAGRRDRAWHVIHDDTAIAAARRLYLTATPRIMDSDRTEVTSMDDEAVFGPEAFRLPFAEAIGRGLLADYRVLVSVVTDSDVAALAARREILSAGGPAVPADMLAAQVAMLRACAEWDLRRVITYHGRVSRAHRFAGTLLNAAGLLGPEEKPAMVRASAVDGSMRLAGRREELRHLRAPGSATVVVANARVLAEGVDVPELDGVMFADPRDSATDVVQAVGRALRKGAGAAKVATIVIPVLTGDGEPPEVALEGSAFAAVWRVLRALRAHDERVADWLDEQRARSTAAHLLPGTARHETPDWLHVRGIPVTGRFARALGIRLVGAATSSWMDYLAAARAFHAGHGHLDMPAAAVAGDVPLGRWIADQRTRRKRGELTGAQVAALDALGMTWDHHAAGRARLAAEASAFREQRGHLDVPRDYVTPGGYPLGPRIAGHRSARGQGRLNPETEALLDALGMTWAPVASGRDAEIARARAYYDAHGHIDIPDGYADPDGHLLGKWLARQRNRRRAGTLHPERAAALEAMGVNWVPAPDAWAPALERAREYRRDNGHLGIPLRYRSPDGYGLGAWLSQRRVEYRKGALAPDRTAALEELGVTWNVLDAAWEEGLRHAAGHAREHGTLRVHRDYVTPDGFRLGRWLVNSRARYRQGKMHASRERRLDAIGADWR